MTDRQMTDRQRRRLEKLADHVRRCYADQRSQIFPNYSMKREYVGHSIWMRAAEHLLGTGASPDVLIEAAFHAIRPFPTPPQLLSPRVLEAMSRKKGPSPAVIRYKYHLDLYLQLRGNPQLPDTVLSDEWHPFTPLFRYVMAKVEGLDALASQYREAAQEYLQRNPDLRAVIPDDSLRTLEEEACP